MSISTGKILEDGVLRFSCDDFTTKTLSSLRVTGKPEIKEINYSAVYKAHQN